MMLSRASLVRCSHTSSVMYRRKLSTNRQRGIRGGLFQTTTTTATTNTATIRSTSVLQKLNHHDNHHHQSHHYRHSYFSSLAHYLTSTDDSSSWYNHQNNNNNNNNNEDVDSTSYSSSNPYQLSSTLGHSQQVRWKRKDGYKSFHQQRPTTRKKLKTYHRRKRRLHHEKVGKHGAPGSKAGPRREFGEEMLQDLISYDPNSPYYDESPQELEYDMSDALLDDLIGNTAEYTSLPTPVPVYLGHDQETFQQKVKHQLNKYQAYQEQLVLLESQGDTTTTTTKNGETLLPSVDLKEEKLPDDKLVALALRSYRDKYGTKHKPIGLVKALQYLLKDLKVPSQKPCWGEHTFTTLLTCCRTPKEARRVFKLMLEDHGHPISAYSWSILADIHAKLGDFEGCYGVLQEMKHVGGIPHIPLAAYTSFFAACYKVCNAGQIPHTVRAKAGKLSWESWRELNIENVEKPDTMAYGAMLRLCAARGHPERAINLLEEMQQFDVKPTTLCFTSALKAISKSHQTALRYERGTSKVNKRREQITCHHGKLARTVVILAENAEVEQDTGFVAALMLCAAAAGDSATAKAILIASDVRNMSHLRTIGSKDHLQRLAGEDVVEPHPELSPSTNQEDPWQVISGGPTSSDGPLQTSREPSTFSSNTSPDHKLMMTDSSSSSSSSLSNSPPRSPGKHPPTRKTEKQMYEEREYGRNDTRTLSALLLACSQAAESKGLGDMWAGRDSKGYLCENSLRLLPMRRQPKYMDYSVPGISHTEMQRSALTWDEDEPEHMSKRLRRAKFMGVDIDEDAGFDMETIPEDMKSMFTHDPMPEEDTKSDTVVNGIEDGTSAAKLLGTDEILKDGTGDPISMFGDDVETMMFNDQTGEFEDYVPDNHTTTEEKEQTDDEPEEEWYFDDDIRRWKTRPKNVAISDTATERNSSGSTTASNEQEIVHSSEEEEDVDWYFNDDKMQWETRPKKASSDDIQLPVSDEAPGSVDKQSSSNEDREFALFYEGLKEELRQSGDVDAKHIDEGLAREVFNMEKEKNPKAIQEAFAENKVDPDEDMEIDEQEFRLFYEGLKLEVGEDEHVDEMDARMMFKMMMKGELDDDEDDDDNEDDDVDFEEKYGGTDSDFEAQFDDELKHAQLALSDDPTDETLEPSKQNESFEDFFSNLKDEWRSDGFDLDLDDIEKFDKSNRDPSFSQQALPEMEELAPELSRVTAARHDNAATPTTRTIFADEMRHPESENLIDSMSELSLSEQAQNSNAMEEAEYKEQSLEKQEIDYVQQRKPLNRTEAELAEALPGLPPSRIRKLRKVFDKTLGTPSMLRLVPLLRENMPEYVDHRWLKQKNAQNSHFVMKKAKDEGMVDVHMLNGLLQLQASCGNFNVVLQVHEEQFKKYNLKPTPYSDRIAVQMLVKHNRISRALVLKEKIESDGRNLDILSYGTMIEYYSRRGHLGSSVMLLRECIDLHGASPPEKYLTKTRLLCRQQEVEDKVGIEALIGEDPVEWIRHGEANLKREYSKKGHLYMNHIRNAMRTGN